jgi:hypothetical protein
VATLLGLVMAAWVAPGGAAAAAPRAEVDPLLVSITSLSPSQLPSKGPITIRGTVTNQSLEQWTRVNLLAFRSVAPITDATSLAASAAIDPSEYVGDRITTPGTFDTVDVLDPGQTSEFEIKVSRSELEIGDSPGVYWIGVHALGDSSVPRDEIADGRARTFVPQVARTREQVDAALVVPLRATVWHTPDGRVDRIGQWTSSLSDGGRLDALLDVSDASGSAPLTWLVDPAVPAAVAQLAVGNPPRSLAPDPNVPEETTESDSPGPSPTEQPYSAPTPVAPTGEPAAELSAEEQAAATAATAWLARFRTTLASDSVLSLPYGDLDVSAAIRQAPTFYDRAMSRGAEVMAGLGVPASPAVAPRDGILSPAALEATTPQSTVLLGDTSFALPPSTASSMVRLLGHKVVVTSSGAASGGPAPTAADDPLALRQRLLSEAALRLSAGSTAPVVLMLPADWHPADPTALFDGLDVPWLRPVSVDAVAARSAESLTAADLAYTEEDAEAELDATSFSAAQGMLAAGDLMAGVLTRQSTLQGQLRDEALTTLSSGHREQPGRAIDSAADAGAYLRSQLGSIRVEAPPSVTLSSETGSLGATVVNELDQAVTVQVQARSDGSLELQEQDAMRLAPESRTRILLKITARRLGIHDVRLVVTDQDGNPLGSSDELPVRAAQVSELIWYAIAAGAALLFGAIGVRLVRRVRKARADGRSADEAEETDEVTEPTRTAPSEHPSGATT